MPTATGHSFHGYFPHCLQHRVLGELHVNTGIKWLWVFVHFQWTLLNTWDCPRGLWLFPINQHKLYYLESAVSSLGHVVGQILNNCGQINLLFGRKKCVVHSWLSTGDRCGMCREEEFLHASREWLNPIMSSASNIYIFFTLILSTVATVIQ